MTTPAKVILANPRGFCAGVDRAIEIVERALELFGAPIAIGQFATVIATPDKKIRLSVWPDQAGKGHITIGNYCLICPGVRISSAAGITANPMSLKASETMHPLGRIGRPEEVATVISWLLSDSSGWVTGQVIGVDGGLSTIRTRPSA